MPHGRRSSRQRPCDAGLAAPIGKFWSEVPCRGVPDEAGEAVLSRPGLKVPVGGRMY